MNTKTRAHNKIDLDNTFEILNKAIINRLLDTHRRSNLVCRDYSNVPDALYRYYKSQGIKPMEKLEITEEDKYRAKAFLDEMQELLKQY